MSSTIYDPDNGCKKCLKSSPVPSLIGMIFVLLGGTAFGTGVIFARSSIKEILNDGTEKSILPYLDETVYGLIGAIGLFTILAYLLCALSTGQNAKDCFNTSGKSICGRCCNMFLILCLFFGVLLWIGIVCLLAYSVISVSFLTNRQVMIGASQGIDMANVFGSNTKSAALVRERRQTDIGFPTVVAQAEAIDLSYYGFFVNKQRIQISANKFDKEKEKLILCTASATIGTLMMLFGYLLITICVAINYARLQEFRYYEIDNCNYDESAALRG